LSFSPGGRRSLVYAQNPEQILPEDLADNGISTLTIDAITGGRFRDWWELQNSCGKWFGKYEVCTASLTHVT
jgi:hypothetical protein